MSYCRFSSMDFACDIYAYESVGDFWQIYVAGNRVLGDVPKLPPWPARDAPVEVREAWAHDYAEASKAQHDFLQTAEREDITLPHAGESFQCATLEAFRDKMLELREIGYRFPDAVLDVIDEELAAENDADDGQPDEVQEWRDYDPEC